MERNITASEVTALGGLTAALAIHADLPKSKGPDATLAGIAFGIQAALEDPSTALRILNGFRATFQKSYERDVVGGLDGAGWVTALAKDYREADLAAEGVR